MVSTGISEFTFGFGFLYEQVRANWKNLKVAPILPSLQKEKDEGWDARLPLKGTDFYYQFKLSDYLSHGHAMFIKDGTYSGHYYRIALHRRDNNRQHNLLVKLAKKSPNTFYVAPEFSGVETFNKAFLDNKLLASSRLIPLKNCKQFNNSAQHYITFQKGKPQWEIHSEVQRFEKSWPGTELESLYKESSQQWRPIDKTFAEEIFERVSKQVKGLGVDDNLRPVNEALLDIEAENRDRNGFLKRSAELLSLNFGTTLVIVGKGTDEGAT